MTIKLLISRNNIRKDDLIERNKRQYVDIL